jgi:hypothetical protein
MKRFLALALALCCTSQIVIAQSNDLATYNIRPRGCAA